MQQQPFKVLACDVGVTGALVLFIDGKAVDFIAMPKKWIPFKNKAKRKQVIDLKQLVDIFANINPDVTIIEKVHAMPNQGVTSMFSFGVSYGYLKALAQAFSKEWCEVSPQDWKKHSNLLGSEKKGAIVKAEILTGNKLSSGKADAYFIGLWWLENNVK